MLVSFVFFFILLCSVLNKFNNNHIKTQNMKKLFFLITLMFSFATSFALGEPTKPLPLKPTNQGGAYDPFPRGPIDIPEVYLEDNELSFDSSLEGCTVQLLDADEEVVFTDSIDVNQTSLTLPSTLSGTYELQIVCGSITFYCYIDL